MSGKLEMSNAERQIIQKKSARGQSIGSMHRSKIDETTFCKANVVFDGDLFLWCARYSDRNSAKKGERQLRRTQLNIAFDMSNTKHIVYRLCIL